ncbi:hypothetical protein ILUMI_25828, partial [Ignelater luminosus]
ASCGRYLRDFQVGGICGLRIRLKLEIYAAAETYNALGGFLRVFHADWPFELVEPFNLSRSL